MEFITPVGRLVQGSLSLEAKTDYETDKPKLDENGNVQKECYIAVAFRKDDPLFAPFYAQMVACAKADFPHLFNGDTCLNPKFAWKLQDGDGVDTNGKSVADKPGFKGHWIVKMGTQFMPRCFHFGKYDPTQEIQNPSQVIKKGYYVRVAGQMRGNGVAANEVKKVPGLFISPNLVELVAFGEEIVSGPNAAEVFGKAGAAPLPPGASATPLAPAGAAPSLPGLPTGAPSLPGLPTGAPSLPGLPTGAQSLPGAGPALPGAPALPGVGPALPGAPALPAAPVYAMTASAGGLTREQLLAQGWTDELLLQHGHMVKTN